MGNGENEQRTWSTKSTVSSRQWQNQMEGLPAHWLRGRAHEGLKEPALEEILDSSETYLNRIFEQLVEQICKDLFRRCVSNICFSKYLCLFLLLSFSEKVKGFCGNIFEGLAGSKKLDKGRDGRPHLLVCFFQSRRFVCGRNDCID